MKISSDRFLKIFQKKSAALAVKILAYRKIRSGHLRRWCAHKCKRLHFLLGHGRLGRHRVNWFTFLGKNFHKFSCDFHLTKIGKVCYNGISAVPLEHGRSKV